MGSVSRISALDGIRGLSVLAVEEGDRICDNNSGQKRYHRECNKIQYNSKIYI